MAGKKGSELRIKQGGLMRCCLETARTYEGNVKRGQIIDCKYEREGNHSLRISQGWFWEWNREEVLARAGLAIRDAT